MTEMILPGTVIEVRAEGLTVPARVSVGNIGIVGTASQGPVNEAVTLGGMLDARETFGDADAWVDGNSNELTLMRALQLVYDNGATNVVAVRVASGTAKPAEYLLSSAGGENVRLTARSKGSWGNGLEVHVQPAKTPAMIENEAHNGDGTPAINLAHKPALKSARNRVRLFTAADGLTRTMQIIYDDDPNPPTASQVKLDRAAGTLTFSGNIDAADKVNAWYQVDPASAVLVTLRYGTREETYTVVNGADLAEDINRKPGGSAWVEAKALANSGEIINTTTGFGAFGTGSNQAGNNGEDADAGAYISGLELLTNEDVHIIVAAGMDDTFADELAAHVKTASSEAIRRDRMAVVGTTLAADFDAVRSHNIDSDRVIFVTPGITTFDRKLGKDVVLPGSYAAAAFAGLLASLPPHYSPTNKVIAVGGLEKEYSSTHLAQLVQNRVLAIEKRQGFRVVKGITTATDSAWRQITTRRIVDYAKFGVRSAANPFIGKLNNERVRTDLRTSIATFMNLMLNDEMVTLYDLSVSATREEERQGIVRVTLIMQPVFSIDNIVVTMFLQ